MASWVLTVPLVVVSFVISEVLEKDVVKNESEDEFEGLAALFFLSMNGNLPLEFVDT